MIKEQPPHTQFNGSEFEVNFQLRVLEIEFEGFSLVQNLVFSILENNAIILPTLKRTKE